ncbi:hypothetical protein [Amycolatopsis sp. lyj-112]|uniref:hypothetical protein n=1 Tax=Amycolatopsis sp. lyj-112 TaxID=2789288 RepID=UPI00397A4CF1
MKRPWWLLAVVVAGSVLPVSACSMGVAAKCEKTFAEVAMSVDGVISAKWDCSEQFGGGWQRADVVIEAADKKEAVAVMDAVLKAFAASPDLEDRWSTPQKYKTQDPSIIVSAGDVGFNGTPQVREVREHYGITPG